MILKILFNMVLKPLAPAAANIEAYPNEQGGNHPKHFTNNLSKIVNLQKAKIK
jgi:hypothetical protein